LTVYEQNVERATRSELWARGDQVQVTWSPDHSFVVPEPAEDDSTESSGAGVPATATSA
jgi:hypothetical protein